MRNLASHGSKNGPHPSPRRRRGATAFEVIVSFTLLSSVLAFATPLVVRHTRLMAAQRQYRLALDELSNQLERLSAMPAAELADAVAKVAPSEFASEHLPGAELKGQMAAVDLGQRVTLQLTWDEPQRNEAPLSMSAWIVPDSQPTSSREGGERP